MSTRGRDLHTKVTYPDRIYPPVPLKGSSPDHPQGRTYFLVLSSRYEHPLYSVPRGRRVGLKQRYRPEILLVSCRILNIHFLEVWPGPQSNSSNLDWLRIADSHSKVRYYLAAIPVVRSTSDSASCPSGEPWERPVAKRKRPPAAAHGRRHRQVDTDGGLRADPCLQQPHQRQ